MMAIFTVGAYAQDFHKIGKEHNDILKNTLIHLSTKNDLNKTNGQGYIISYISSNYSSSYYLFNNYEDPFKMLEELKTKGMISNELYQLILTDLNYFKNNEKSITTYTLQRSNANINLSDKEKQAYLAFLSVAYNSYEFWVPEKGDGLKYMGAKAPQKPKINWWKVVGCDALGALGGGVTTVISSGCYIISVL